MTRISKAERLAMPLLDLFTEYVLCHTLRPQSAESMRYSLAAFEKFLVGRPATLADFTDDTVNRWLLWYGGQGKAPDTIKTNRRSLLTLWRFAASRKLVKPHDQIRKVFTRSVPKAWDEEDLPKLLQSCMKMRGKFEPSGVERRMFGIAISRVLYETGLRRGDVMRIQRSDIKPDGRVVLIQQKTGHTHVCGISQETIRIIDLMGTAGREYVFGGLIESRCLSRMMKRNIRRAGLPGTMKWFRRSGATHVEKRQKGAGYIFLGHTTPRVTFQSYIDRSQLNETIYMPPAIASVDEKGGVA